MYGATTVSECIEPSLRVSFWYKAWSEINTPRIIYVFLFYSKGSSNQKRFSGLPYIEQMASITIVRKAGKTVTRMYNFRYFPKHSSIVHFGPSRWPLVIRSAWSCSCLLAVQLHDKKHPVFDQGALDFLGIRSLFSLLKEKLRKSSLSGSV